MKKTFINISSRIVSIPVIAILALPSIGNATSITNYVSVEAVTGGQTVDGIKGKNGSDGERGADGVDGQMGVSGGLVETIVTAPSVRVQTTISGVALAGTSTVVTLREDGTLLHTEVATTTREGSLTSNPGIADSTVYTNSDQQTTQSLIDVIAAIHLIVLSYVKNIF